MSDICIPGGSGPGGNGGGGGVRDRDPDNDTDGMEQEDQDFGEEGEEEEVYDAEPEPWDSLPSMKRRQHLNFNFSAGRSKWVINKGLLVGQSTDFEVPVLPLYWDPLVEGSYPPDIPSQIEGDVMGRERSDDTFRYATGKQWVNAYHSDGPEGGMRSFFDRRDGDNASFAFHNPTNLIFGKGIARLGKAISSDFSMGKVVQDPRQWREYDVVSPIFFRDNDMGLPIYYDSFRIMFNKGTSAPQANPNQDSRRSHWNWRDYMYGLPARPTNVGIIDRFRAQGQNSISTPWDNWASAHYSTNLYPVIPFYGPNTITMGLPADAYALDSTMPPPTVGRKIFYDDVTNIPAFLRKQEIELLDIPGGSSFVDINGIYNFYDCVYEDIICQQYAEPLLPNFYKFRPENYRGLEIDGVSAEEVVRSNIDSLKADLLTTDIPAVKRMLERQLGVFSRDAVGSYGVLDANVFGDVKLSDIYANPESDTFKRVYKERRLFPMYAELEFATQHKSLLADALAMGDHSSFMNKLLIGK